MYVRLMDLLELAYVILSAAKIIAVKNAGFGEDAVDPSTDC